MSIVDSLLNGLVRYLQKQQKKRNKSKRRGRGTVSRSLKRGKHKKSRKVKSPARKAKRVSVKNKSTAGKRKTGLTRAGRKGKPDKVKKTKTPGTKVSSGKPLKEAYVGEITHYFSQIQVVVLKIVKEGLRVGDQIRVKGRGGEFVQKTGSLQIESVDVKSARKGQLVGLKVSKPAKAGSKVYKLLKSK